MAHLTLKSLVLGALTSMAVGTVHAANDYPADLVKTQPAIGHKFADLTGKIARKHAWVKNYGVTVPVKEITLGDETYQVLSGCKPHDCPSEKYVLLIAKTGAKGVGAFVINQFSSGIHPSSSKVRWLGQPDEAQVAALAQLLF